MKRLTTGLLTVLGVALLASAALAQPPEERPDRPEGRGAPGGPGEGGPGGPGGGDFVERVMGFDRNGDGKVTKDEMPKQMQDRLLKRADTNGDGALQKQEVKKFAEQMGQGRGGPSRLKRSAEGMIRASKGMLAPVYAPLAAQIVNDFKLAEKEGIGIDLGSGPGTLIVELCKRTRMHWVNADINPHFFPHFFRLAEGRGFGHRVSAMYADAQELPFRDDYADIIVSRGSYHFWPDQKKGFKEIYRVLKPGAVAYIGRGFSRDLRIDVVKRIRARRGGGMSADFQKEAGALRKMMTDLGIRDCRIQLPKSSGGEGVSYGIWVEINKLAVNGKNNRRRRHVPRKERLSETREARRQGRGLLGRTDQAVPRRCKGASVRKGRQGKVAGGATGPVATEKTGSEE